MPETPAAKKSRRFRFSLGTLLFLVTAICACLAVLRMQQQLVATQQPFDVIRDQLSATVPGDISSLLFALQLAGLILGLAIFLIWRMPKSLCVYVFGQSIWIAVTLFAFIFQNVSWSDWLWGPLLAIYFCEPACGLVFACAAMGSALWHRLLSLTVATAALVAIGLAAEVLAILEIQSFGAAISGVIGR